MALSSRHFRKASLCKQTAYYNSTCSQAKTQSAVTAWCLRSGLHCFFYLFSHHTVAPCWNKPRPVGHRAPSAHDKPLNQYLSLDKRCQESFFFSFWRIWSPRRKVLSCSYHSAIQRVLDFFFFFNVQQHLETVDRLVYSFSKRPQKKGRFLKSDTHCVGCGIAK